MLEESKTRQRYPELFRRHDGNLHACPAASMWQRKDVTLHA